VSSTATPSRQTSVLYAPISIDTAFITASITE